MSAELAEPLEVPPAFVYRPPRVRSMVGPLSGLSERLGRPLDPEQRTALDVLTGVRADGRPATLGAAVICPRQNMKSWLFELIVLGRLLDNGGDRLIVWSAHEVSTSQNTFRDFQQLIADHRWLERRVRRISQANGKEGIEFAGGRWLRFKARIRTGGRGLSGDAVILDEAFALLADHMGALLPILSTRRRAAVFYGSSAGRIDSEVLRGIRDRGRAGLPGSPAYVEYCAPGSLSDPGCTQGAKCRHAPGTPGCVLDDEALWLLANPAARSGRISLDYLRDERLELGSIPQEFARERLGWWDDPTAGQDTIPLGAWDGRTDPKSLIQGPRVIAVEVATDAGSSAIAGAGYRVDGDEHLALVDHRPGTSWAVPRVVELLERSDVGAVVVDPGAPGAMLLPDLKAAGLTIRSEANPAGEIVLMTTRDAGAAAGMLKARIAGDAPSAWHRGDQILQQALRSAGRRPIGNGGWGFDRRGDDDITPIVAVAEALWGLVVGALPDVSLFVGDDAEDQDQAAEGEAPAGGRDPEFPNQFHVEPPRDDDAPAPDDDEDGGDVASWIG